MEDIISLSLIKSLLKKKGKNISEKEAETFLVKLERNIVNFYNKNGEQAFFCNEEAEHIRKQVKKDSQFIEAHKRFIEQHALDTEGDKLSTLVSLFFAKMSS